MKEMQVNRNYKARMFAMLFSQKPELLELYNAVNGTHYDDPELLEINTLENAIYMSMQNDVSFIIDSRLSLYEHQSTYSPNLPLRSLLYAADLYSDITKDLNLYSTHLKKIPTPRFLVFYNGEKKQPDKKVLKLSEAFEIPEEEPALELTVIMLNINKGQNKALMDSCKALKDYAEYTYRVRKYAKTMSIENAVEQAITECIEEGVLTEFLRENRAEAKKMSIYEYDREKHMQQEREEWKEIGFEEGRTEGECLKLISLVCKKISKNCTIAEIADMLEESEETIQQIYDTALPFAPEYDTEQVYKKLVEKNFFNK